MVLQSLLQPKGSWLHVLVAPEDFDFLASVDAGTQGVAVRRIRGRKAPTTRALFDEVGAALQFPASFGETWESFDKCLSDLAWLPGNAYVVLVQDALHVLAKEPPGEFRTFLAALDRAGREWGKPGQAAKAKAFVVVLQCAKADEQALQNRLKDCSVSFTTIHATK